MKIRKEDILVVREKFACMQTKEDLLDLLNQAKDIYYGEACQPIALNKLTYYSNPALVKNRYRQFTLKKKTGGVRIINAPDKGLNAILKVLNFVLQCIVEPHNAATGFILNKSIVDNAKTHVGKNYVYNIDLKDFFHSFDRKWVKYGFMIKPFILGKEREELAFLLASLCTHPFEIDGQMKNVLPQGSPTSPTLTNHLCLKLDKKLTSLARSYKIAYSRYADDITFSSDHNVYGDKSFLKKLNGIVENDMNLKLNTKKTRLLKEGYQQSVTGLIVNEKVNVKVSYVKQMRMWLSYWEKYGYAKAEFIFNKDYTKDKGHVKKGKATLVNVLDGKLEFLKMVKGAENDTYTSLKRRFDKLSGPENKVNELLDIWEKEGIDKAKNIYYSNVNQNTDDKK
jgi:hypothetical protein